MGLRREGREAAVQFLFAHDLHLGAGSISDDEREGFWDIHSARRGARGFAENLVKGVVQRLKEIDQHIVAATDNFSLERMASVDRNIIRLAVYEFLACTDVPRAVVINEAIEIAKKYATAESASFVNGVLDRISKNLPSAS
ncbi:MAG: transcription antitermination factor NusB [Verrucomicrobiaceae bacterium]|nr:transcription antitermination factor NusB [Verrucomicrobiaceae bacterium]